MRARAVTAVVVVLAVVAALGVWLASLDLDVDLSLPRQPRCVVQADGRVELDPTQMANAATIAAVGVRRKVPERAVVVALATAYQESGLENLSGGDRDSVGLFQQRPSQGWGTPEQISDPRYAADRFYAALVKVRGWQGMRITEAAQAVQRSAYPEAYQRWAEPSQVLTRALLGEATGAVACALGPDPALRGGAATQALAAMLARDWGRVRTSTPEVGPGLAVPAADTRTGWRYAHWLVAHAERHGVKRVRYGTLEWSAEQGTWAPVTDGTPVAGRVVAEVFGEA